MGQRRKHELSVQQESCKVTTTDQRLTLTFLVLESGENMELETLLIKIIAGYFRDVSSGGDAPQL